MPSLDEEPAAIDGKLHRLLRLAGVRNPGQQAPLQRPAGGRIVQGAHQVQGHGLGLGRHGRQRRGRC